MWGKNAAQTSNWNFSSSSTSLHLFSVVFRKIKEKNSQIFECFLFKSQSFSRVNVCNSKNEEWEEDVVYIQVWINSIFSTFYYRHATMSNWNFNQHRCDNTNQYKTEAPKFGFIAWIVRCQIKCTYQTTSNILKKYTQLSRSHVLEKAWFAFWIALLIRLYYTACE